MTFNMISQNEIEINGNLVKLPCSIMKDPNGKPFIVELNGIIIVNFYPRTVEEGRGLSGIDMERNIWAFDSKGKLVWKVDPPTIRTDRTNPYTSVFERNGKIFGGNWCGYDFEIDLESGAVKPPKNPGRPW